MYPYSVACALILRARNNGDGMQFLGSAFMIRDDTFMTARHVIETTPPPSQEVAAAFTWAAADPIIVGVTDVWTDSRSDIAVGRLTRVPVLHGHLTLAPDDLIFFDKDVHTIEYSDSVNRREVPGEGVFMFVNPSHRKGNIVSSYLADTPPHRVPTDCYDLSYPALAGASGAAVFHADNGEVVGMIVANHDRYLMPSQVEPVIDRPGPTASEGVYRLPMAQAITARHLRDALTQYDDWLDAQRAVDTRPNNG